MPENERKALYGPYGGISANGIDRFRNSAANAVWFHGFDPAMFDLARNTGKAACVEFKTFRADYRKHPELVPIAADGTPIRSGRHLQGICLSQKWYIEERMEALRSGMRAYAPTGVWLDYMIYGGWFETPEPDLQDNCFCPACIEEFRAAENIDAEGADSIIKNHSTQWQRHKTEQMGRFAAAFASVVRGADPACIVGAYMCPWTPEEFNGALGTIFGQDYEEFARSIDVFTPLIYCQKSGRSANWGRAWLEKAENFIPAAKKRQPILDFLDFPESFTDLMSSPVNGWGLQLFSGSKVFESEESAAIFDKAVDKAQNQSKPTS